MNHSPSWNECALVLVGHGSTTNPDSSAPTFAHADALRKRGIFAEVTSCFWKEQPNLREVWFQIESPFIYIVPNFISEGYFTRTVIPREMNLTGRISNHLNRKLFYCDPVGSHPAMTEVLMARALSATSSTLPEKTSLLIVGHGTSLDKNSSTAAQKQAEAIRKKNIFGEVLACFMEEPPSIADWSEITSFPSVVVVPFFISDGLHSYEDIPALLGIDPLPPLAKNKTNRQNLFSIKGKQLHYTNAIGTAPLMEQLFLDQVCAFDKNFLTAQNE